MYGELAVATKYLLLKTWNPYLVRSLLYRTRFVCLLTAQVGAHGTGAAIPPVDEQIVAMKLVTPNLGTLELSNQHNPLLFRMAKVKETKSCTGQLSIFV